MNPLQTDPDTIEIPTADEGIYKVGVRRNRTEARAACLIDCITMLSAACGYKQDHVKASGAFRMLKDKDSTLKEVWLPYTPPKTGVFQLTATHIGTTATHMQPKL